MMKSLAGVGVSGVSASDAAHHGVSQILRDSMFRDWKHLVL